MIRLPIALALLLVGCSDSAPMPATDATATVPDAEVHYLVYACDSGAEIQATYPDLESAEIRYEGDSHQLEFLPASAKSGAEYANETWSWLTSGSAGILTQVGSDEEVERCEQES